MKPAQIGVLSILLLTACNYKESKVIVQGNIPDNATEKLLYSAVFENTSNGWFKETAVTDSSGHFVIAEEIDQPIIITLLYKPHYKQIIIEPGNTYDIEINEETNQIVLKGGGSEAQNFYESLPDNHPLDCSFFQRDILDYQSIYDSLNTSLSHELQTIDKIRCRKEVRDLLKVDIQVYYNLAISSLASRINVVSLNKNEKTPPEIWKMWRDATADSYLTNLQTKNATYFYDLLDIAIWHKIFTKLYNDDFKKIRQEKRESGQIHTHNIQLAHDLLPAETIELYTANYLLSKAKQSNFEKELINLFEGFKSDFPNSKFTKYITPEIDKIIDFQKKIDVDLNADLKIVDNYLDINSLSDCLRPFYGKKVYVDLWATSCGACKEVFQYNEELKKVLESKDVEYLYISFDGDNQDRSWKDMIKYYNLKGYHIRANKMLRDDLNKLIDFQVIPRFLIIDEKGDIQNNDAPRPSRLQELNAQL